MFRATFRVAIDVMPSTKFKPPTPAGHTTIPYTRHHAADPNEEDIIDEALNLFRANCLFRNFEIKGHADRVLIYLILFISECLGKLSKSPTPGEAVKQLSTLAVSNFAIPGDATFPLNAMYSPPRDRSQQDQLRQYIQQLRNEMAIRLVDRVYVDGKPSKWWMCFQKRKFMGLSL
ncbi:hypothetical protein INT43_002431 [Umbelopsis isabellina]|uniref:Actin-related protein 2/3 complex subunit 3 n=1 Tax=Mortierella isabellina TaxID=91625 RepID=A0A8H7UN90_MORIS|nr:hypothetical protein INT43_002431 [Umbelopsis isabellina]